MTRCSDDESDSDRVEKNTDAEDEHPASPCPQASSATPSPGNWLTATRTATITASVNPSSETTNRFAVDSCHINLKGRPERGE